jgi:hypothetical protein
MRLGRTLVLAQATMPHRIENLAQTVDGIAQLDFALWQKNDDACKTRAALPMPRPRPAERMNERHRRAVGSGDYLREAAEFLKSGVIHKLASWLGQPPMKMQLGGNLGGFRVDRFPARSNHDGCRAEKVFQFFTCRFGVLIAVDRESNAVRNIFLGSAARCLERCNWRGKDNLLWCGSAATCESIGRLDNMLQADANEFDRRPVLRVPRSLDVVAECPQLDETAVVSVTE